MEGECEVSFPDSTPLCLSPDGRPIDCAEAPAFAGHWVDAGPPDRFEIRGVDIVDRSTRIVWRSDVIDVTDGVLPLCPIGYRLPTRFDLLTILDYGRSVPAADESIFASQLGWFATSDERQDVRWLVDFTTGEVAQRRSPQVFHVRCMKGDWAPRFERDPLDPEILIETRSGLLFRAGTEYVTSFSHAAARCAALAPSRCGPWRVPSVKELLLAFRTDDGTLHPVFDLHEGAGYHPRGFTSSPKLPFEGKLEVWGIDLSEGTTIDMPLEEPEVSSSHVVCVSGGALH